MIHAKHRLLTIFFLVLSVICFIMGEGGLLRCSEINEMASPFISETDSIVALQQASEELLNKQPDIEVSTCILQEEYWLQTTNGDFISFTVIGISPGWFDLNPHRLIDGRYLGEAEIVDGAAYALITPELAYALWGEEKCTGYNIEIDGIHISITGIVTLLLPTDQPMRLYLPFSLALKNTQPDVQILSTSGSTYKSFEEIAQYYFPRGTCYSLKKEKIRFDLPFRILIVALMISMLRILYCRIKKMNHTTIGKWKQQKQHVYAEKMVGITIRLGVQWLLLSGAWLMLLYCVLQYAVEPLRVLSELFPQDPLDLQSWLHIFSFTSQQSMMQITLTDSAIYMQRCGSYIRSGFILMIIAHLVNCVRAITSYKHYSV